MKVMSEDPDSILIWDMRILQIDVATTTTTTATAVTAATTTTVIMNRHIINDTVRKFGYIRVTVLKHFRGSRKMRH